MTISLVSIRVLFFILSILVSINVAVQNLEGGASLINIAIGGCAGVVLAGSLASLDVLFKRVNLRSFNTAIIGLFCGYLMAQAILLIFEAVNGPSLYEPLFMPIRFFVYLFTAYLGMVVAVRAGEEFHLSIPFIELKPVHQRKREMLVDGYVLHDPRVLDLAVFGLLDDLLIFPRFALAELYVQADSSDEMIRGKAKRALDALKKLESLPTLNLRFIDTDFPDMRDTVAKLLRLAGEMELQLMTSDTQRFLSSLSEGVHIINLHHLSHAPKPAVQAGEVLSIQIQHAGKGPRQGVGYLEDGTMVVVNGGLDFVGDTIKGRVISAG